LKVLRVATDFKTVVSLKCRKLRTYSIIHKIINQGSTICNAVYITA